MYLGSNVVELSQYFKESNVSCLCAYILPIYAYRTMA